jgi:hypothetical protein
LAGHLLELIWDSVLDFLARLVVEKPPEISEKESLMD